jgi:osmotically-inducible protein OsmY
MATRAEDIKKAVVDQLYWDSRVDASDIRVDVFESKVKLSGTVPTLSSREAALGDALTVPGVATVENDLSVRFPSTISVPRDDQVRLNVESMLRWSPDIDPSEIEVTVEGGVVTLRGTVDLYWKKSKAEDLASNVTGVLSVDNQLAVAPSDSYVDKSIAEDIVSALERNAYIHADSVNVEVEGGRVTLSGKVPDRAAYNSAADVSRFTPGVIDVENRLTIE